MCVDVLAQVLRGFSAVLFLFDIHVFVDYPMCGAVNYQYAYSICQVKMDIDPSAGFAMFSLSKNMLT